MSSLQQFASEATLNSVGASGSKEITGTSAVTPPTGYYFFKIQIITNTVVAAQVDGITNQADLSTVGTIPALTEIYGNFTSITLTSGTAIGYLARI